MRDWDYVKGWCVCGTTHMMSKLHEIELVSLMIEDCDSLWLDVIHNIFWWFMLIMGGWAMLLMIDLWCFRKQINFSLLKLLTLNDVN